MLEGLEEVQFRFEQNVVKGFTLKYGQLFDVMYRSVDSRVKEQFSPSEASHALDTILCTWKYDSLNVTFEPNRKQHWTGSFYVFTPVLKVSESSSAPPEAESSQE